MIALLIKLFVAVIIITVAAEYMLNRAASTWLAAGFVVVTFSTIYFLIYLPLKKQSK